MELNKKVAIITGSAQGLGKAFAARLLKEGAKVCISDVNKDKGEAALFELQEKFGAENVHFVSCDVTSDGSLVIARYEFRRISSDGLITILNP